LNFVCEYQQNLSKDIKRINLSTMLVKCEFYQSFGDSLSFDNEADNNAPALKIS